MGFPVSPYSPVLTWTPELTFETPGDLTVVYSTQQGNYTVLGGILFWFLSIVTSTFTHTTASGSLRVTGLPIIALGTIPFAGSCRIRGYTKANYTQIMPNVDPGSAYIEWEAAGSGQAATELAAGDMPTGGTVNIVAGGSYLIQNVWLVEG